MAAVIVSRAPSWVAGTGCSRGSFCPHVLARTGAWGCSTASEHTLRRRVAPCVVGAAVGGIVGGVVGGAIGSGVGGWVADQANKGIHSIAKWFH